VPRTNTLAYFSEESGMKKKRFCSIDVWFLERDEKLIFNH